MAKRKTAEEPEKSFEELLDETESLVDRLESGDLPLDEALAVYEQGIGNIKDCAKKLRATEERIRVLQENAAGDLELAELDADESSDDDDADDDADDTDGNSDDDESAG